MGYDTSILILTAICAIFTIIGAMPVISGWLKQQRGTSMNATTNSLLKAPSKWRWLILITIACVALGVSLFGLYRVNSYEGAVVHFPKNDLIYIYGKHYANEEVLLDGIHFDECTFQNVTLTYNGTRSFSFTHNKFNGTMHIKTDSDSVEAAVFLLVGVGFVKPGISMLDKNNEPMEYVTPPDGAGQIH